MATTSTTMRGRRTSSTRTPSSRAAKTTPDRLTTSEGAPLPITLSSSTLCGPMPGPLARAFLCQMELFEHLYIEAELCSQSDREGTFGDEYSAEARSRSPGAHGQSQSYRAEGL